MSPVTAERARELLDGATPEWFPVRNALDQDSGIRGAVFSAGGPWDACGLRSPDLALACASHDLARTVIALEAERAALRTKPDDVRTLQDVVRLALIRALDADLPGENHDLRIDGGGSDGDEFDFTRAEISIATGIYSDALEALRVERDALRARVAEMEAGGEK